jgi:hypothetical protein
LAGSVDGDAPVIKLLAEEDTKEDSGLDVVAGVGEEDVPEDSDLEVVVAGAGLGSGPFFKILSYGESG